MDFISKCRTDIKTLFEKQGRFVASLMIASGILGIVVVTAEIVGYVLLGLGIIG